MLVPLDQLLKEDNIPLICTAWMKKEALKYLLLLCLGDSLPFTKQMDKRPAIPLVCEVATSEAQSCLHSISFCGNSVLKIDEIHQCNPSSISSFRCDFMEAPCHFRYKHHL